MPASHTTALEGVKDFTPFRCAVCHLSFCYKREHSGWVMLHSTLKRAVFMALAYIIQLCDEKRTGSIQCEYSGSCTGSEGGWCNTSYVWSGTYFGEPKYGIFWLYNGNFTSRQFGVTWAYSVRCVAGAAWLMHLITTLKDLPHAVFNRIDIHKLHFVPKEALCDAA